MKKRTFESPKLVFVAGMLYVFIILTVAAFLLHFVGLRWFATDLERLPEPGRIIQQIVNAFMKFIELVFVYKILICKKARICMIISIIEVVGVGFLPQNWIQSVADAGIMLLSVLIFRRDKGWGIVDFIALYGIVTLYALFMLIAKFGNLTLDYSYNFYTGILSLIDYKLFIITLYLYIKLKGGIKLWKTMKRPLFNPKNP